MPSLPEGEEDHAGRGLGIVLKTVVAPRSPMLTFHADKSAFQTKYFSVNLAH